MAIDTIETTKGVVSPVVRPTSSVWTTAGNFQDSDTQPHSPLQLFQLLVGIHTPRWLAHEGLEVDIANGRETSAPSSSQSQAAKKPPRDINIGLYQRAKSEERRARLAYISTSFISNTLFLLQIMLSAAFTGLSAYKEANAVVLTILGAFNTVVAGCLAWQKGQGVPQRYRKAMDQYQALILEIEMAERSFVDIGNNVSTIKLNPREEKARLQKLFDTAKADQQANYPDLYVSTGAAVAKESKDLAHQLDEVKAEAAKVQGEMMARIEALLERVESKAEAKVEGKADELLAVKK